MNITYYKKYNNTVGNKVDLFKSLEQIKNGTYFEQIKLVRLQTDKKERDLEKKKLPLLGFGGVFKTRSNNNLISPSGIAVLDFDGVDDLQRLINDVNSDQYTFSSFISPSGNGLKVLVKIPPVGSDEGYKSFYYKIQEHYNKYGDTDPSTKDISRASFVSYDPHLYLNVDSDLFTDRKVFEIKQPQQIAIPVNDVGEIAEKLIVWFKKKWTTGVNRNNNLFILSAAFNDYGVPKDIALNYCLQYQSQDFKDKEITQLVNSAYKNTANFGSKQFEDTKKVGRLRKLAEKGTKLDSVKQMFGNSKAIEEQFNKATEQLTPDEFWYYTEKGVIKLATFRFLNYLENNNISKYYPDIDNDTFHFIRKESNFVSLFGESKIKDFTLNDLRNRGCIDAFELMANYSNNFSSNYLSMIKTTNLDVNKDTADTSYIYYKNKVVKTTKNGSELINYDSLEGYVWKNQIINRDVFLNESSDGVFKTFIWNLSGQNKDRYYTLKSVIGYLMHSYQNESNSKAIIFNDEMISDDVPNGGSGKGLIHKAIGQIKNIVVEDGKKFDPRGQFAYQKVNKDTQIFLMDDVPRNFNFENLFSIITEGMTIEKKNQDAFTIPFVESPKLSITTNYTIKGDGASHYRRVFEVEIANHYNDNFTPFQEFKHQFFHDWNNEEWAKFDNYMIRCVQYFLKYGLVESNKINLEFRKLKQYLGQEFVEFMEAKDLSNLVISRKEFREKFNKEYPTLQRFNSAQIFNKKVKEYCKYYKIELGEKKYNGTMNFYFNDEVESNEDSLPF